MLNFHKVMLMTQCHPNIFIAVMDTLHGRRGFQRERLWGEGPSPRVTWEKDKFHIRAYGVLPLQTAVLTCSFMGCPKEMGPCISDSSTSIRGDSGLWSLQKDMGRIRKEIINFARLYVLFLISELCWVVIYMAEAGVIHFVISE